MGYLYVRPDLGKKLEPKFTGWFAHQNPMAFEVGPIRYTDAPFRFMNGTSHIPALEAARPGLKIIAEVGIRADSRKIKEADGAIDRTGRQTGLAGELAARSRKTRRHRFH